MTNRTGVNLYKKENNTQLVIYNSFFIIKSQLVLHVSALFPAIIYYSALNSLRLPDDDREGGRDM